MRLWRRFQLWQAMRLYAFVPVLERLARRITARADRLVRDSTVDPQQRFRFGGEDD